MFRHVLVPTDGSKLSSAALDQAIDFAKHVGAKITVLTVVEPFYVFAAQPDQLAYSVTDYDLAANTHAAQILSEAEGKVRQAGVEVTIVRAASDSPYEAIIATAVEHGCDLIAMGSHGRSGVAAVLIGSQTSKVLAHSKIPVLVYR